MRCVGQFCREVMNSGQLSEADMSPVNVGDRVSDDVLEVEPALGTLESTRAAALDDGVLAAPVNFYPGRHVGIPLRLEPVGCRERTHGSAVEAANEDLFAAFEVYAARRLLSRDDLRVQAPFEAAGQRESWIA